MTFEVPKLTICLLLALAMHCVKGKKCGSGEFTCKNGDCIVSSWHCDGGADCDDKSDEENCQISCKKPKIRHGKLKIFGKKSQLHLVPGTKLQFKCNRKYRMVGSPVSKCLETGGWSGFRAKCIGRHHKQTYCSLPKAPRNGTVKPHTGKHLKVNSNIIYACEPEFKLVGKRTRLCQSNGKWSLNDPYCERKNCKDPGLIPNGSVFGSGFAKGKSLLFTCKTGFEMVGENTIYCLNNGAWSDPPPRCISENEALNHKAKQLSKNFINRLKLLTVDGKGRSGHSSSAQGLDLVFVLDYSESVGRNNFEKAIEFVESMIDYFGLSSTKEGTHVALVVFADQPKLIFNLLSEKVYEKKIALDTLGKITFSGGGTGVRPALDLVNAKVKNETRKFAKKVLFVVTDGNHNVGGDPSRIARFLREKVGFEIYTVGISNFVDRENLEKLASLPFNKHVYMLKSFDMLDKLKDMVNNSNIDYDSCGLGGDTQSKTPGNKAIKVKKGAWPWTVNIAVDGPSVCAGVLITKKWVLTAASCVKDASPDQIRIVTGMHSRAIYTGSEQSRRCQKIEINTQKINGKTIDIALVKLHKKVVLNEYTKVICFPDDFDYISYVRPFKSAFTVGWGAGDTQFFEQHQGHVRLVDKGRCQRPYLKSNVTIENHHLCVENSGSKKIEYTKRPVCAASIGSPLLVHRTSSFAGNRQIYSWALTGILSRGDGCQEKKTNKFSVFTDVYQVMDWIKQITQKSKKNR